MSSASDGVGGADLIRGLRLGLVATDQRFALQIVGHRRDRHTCSAMPRLRCSDGCGSHIRASSRAWLRCQGRTWAGHYCEGVSGFSLPVVPRYAEVDQQGVVFNGHYLTWFDEACTGFLDHLGVTYPGLIATGHDVQVVHTEIDYLASVRWRDSVRVAVQCERIGCDQLHAGVHGAAAQRRLRRTGRCARPQRLRRGLHRRLGQASDSQPAA